MSSEDDVLIKRRLGEHAQVEIPAAGGRNARLDERVRQAIERWVWDMDWEMPAKVEYFTEVNDDGVRCRIGRFVVLDPWS